MVAVLILAAGSGSRMGAPKAALEIGGQRLVDRAVNLFRDAGYPEIYVVLGAWIGEVPHAQLLINHDWEEGMGSSLRLGLSQLIGIPEITEVIVSLVDLPGLTAVAIKRIGEEPHDLVVATFEGKQGHPVKFGRAHWQPIIEGAGGDVGARNYLKGRPDVHYISLDGLANGKDVDTPAELKTFNS